MLVGFDEEGVCSGNCFSSREGDSCRVSLVASEEDEVRMGTSVWALEPSSACAEGDTAPVTPSSLSWPISKGSLEEAAPAAASTGSEGKESAVTGSGGGDVSATAVSPSVILSSFEPVSSTSS